MELPINRRWRVLLKRHGPASAVWRRRIAMGLGAVTIGLVALLFARLADEASRAFEQLVHAAWWLPMLVTPLGFAAIAWMTRTLAPEAAGSGIPQVIAATHYPKRSLRTLISPRIAAVKGAFHD